MAGGPAYDKAIKEAQQKGQQEQQKQEQLDQQQKEQSLSGSHGGGSGGGTIVDKAIKNDSHVDWNSREAQFIQSLKTNAGISAPTTITEAKDPNNPYNTAISDWERGNSLTRDKGAEDLALSESFFGNQHLSSDKILSPKSDSKSEPIAVLFGSNDKAQQNNLSIDQIYRGSAKEDLVKQRESERAGKIYPSELNQDYFTGGKPSDNIIWKPPIGNEYKNMGQGIDNSLIRNSPAEAKAKISEANRASLLFYPQQKEFGDNKVFTIGGPKNPTENNQGGVVTEKSLGKSYGTLWVNAQLGTTQNYRGNTKEQQSVLTTAGKTKSPPISSISDVNNQISFANGLTSLSNKQIAANNLKNEQETKAYFNQGQKEGATFVFLTGSQKEGFKPVGETSGPRSFYDFLKAQKEFGNISIQKTYPQREKELSQAVGKNPDFYLTLSPAYWKALSESGYYTEKNAPKINRNLQTHWTAQNLGLLQGTLYSEQHGGPVPSQSGVIFVAPAEHEVASFLRFPFSGGKEYNQFISSLGFSPSGKKLSTSRVPSTSMADVAQFYPGLPVVGKLSELSSEGLAKAFLKGGIKFGETKLRTENKLKTDIGLQAKEAAMNYEPIRPTNLKELEPVGLQVSKQTMGKRPPTALETALSREPRVKENPNYTPSSPQNLPIQGRGPFDINLPGSVSSFKKPVEVTSNILSPKEQSIRERFPLMTNTLPKQPLPKPTESFDLFGKASGVPPIKSKTKPNSNLSPISREFFGVQFTGSYPSSYLPPAAGLISKSERPVVNLNERGDYQDFRFRQFMERANTQGKFGFSISPRNEGPLPEDLNPLGRRGKTPVKSTITSDFTLSRAKVVEETTPRYQHEVFTAKGKALSPSIVFGETKPVGALGKGSIKSKSQKSIIDLAPQKDYQDWRNTMINTKGNFKFGFKTGPEKPVINLEPRKDYQDWRFSKFQEKNPPKEEIGSIRFDTFLSKLPTQNKKAPVFSVNKPEPKSKVGFRRASKSLFEIKPVQQTKEPEIKNTGSKSETVLLQKPLTRRRMITSQEQQYDYGYEFRPVPESKSGQGTISGILSGTLSKPNVKFKQESLIANLNKTLERTKPQSGYKQSSKQTGRLFLSETQTQKPKQLSRLFSSPRQTQKPKQGQKLSPKYPSPQMPKLIQSPMRKSAEEMRIPQRNIIPPPKPKPPLQLIGSLPYSRRSKSKNGPTALENLSVNNIFSSSLNITVKKGQRYEF